MLLEHHRSHSLPSNLRLLHYGLLLLLVETIWLLLRLLIALNLSIGHSCHASIILSSSLIHLEVANPVPVLVSIHLTHQQTQRSNQRYYIGVV